jgi:PAS domain S-box-containing protein
MSDPGLWIVVALAIVALADLVFVLSGAWRSAGGVVGDAVSAPLGLLSGLLCLRKALWRANGPRIRWAWTLLGLAFLFYFAGDVFWLVNDAIVSGGSASPSWADVPYLLYYPVLLAGLVVLGTTGRPRPETLRAHLDAGVVLVGGFLLVWYFVLRPVLSTGGGGLADAIAVAYPVGDFLLLIGAATLTIRRGWMRSRTALVALFGGLGVELVCDLFYGSRTISDSYTNGGLLSWGYVVALLLFALAAQQEYHAAGSPSGEGEETAATGHGVGVLSYGSIVVGLGVLAYALRGSFASVDGAAALGALLVFILAFIRQVVAMRESARFREREAVEESERRYAGQLRRSEFSVDHVGESIVWINRDGRVLDANDAACRLLEYSRDELLAKTVFDLDPALAERPGLWSAHWDRLLEVGSLVFEGLRRTKSGRAYPAEITVGLLEIDGEVYGCSISRDITDRKLTEKTLRESEERLIRAQEVGHVGSWESELASGRLWGSAEAFRIYGVMGGAGWLPVPVIQSIPLEEDRPMMMEAWRALLEEGAAYSIYYRIRRFADGAVRTVHTIADRVLDEYGVPYKVVGTIEDVTERRQVEATLRLTQFSVDRASDSVFWLDPAGAILYVNDAASVLLGYSSSELLRMTIFDICEELTPDRWPERFAEIGLGVRRIVERSLRSKEPGRDTRGGQFELPRVRGHAIRVLLRSRRARTAACAGDASRD